MAANLRRRGAPGELCTCGRQAVLVAHLEPDGGVGDCGRRVNASRVLDRCVFCDDAVDHAHYARRERPAGRILWWLLEFSSRRDRHRRRLT